MEEKSDNPRRVQIENWENPWWTSK